MQKIVFKYLVAVGVLIILLLKQGSAQTDEQMKQLEELRRVIEKTLKEEEIALSNLSVLTLNLDIQVQAVEEIKMLKSDLDVLRQQRTGIEKGNEKALGDIDEIAAEIIYSAEQIQMAKTDAEVIKVMARAREKVLKIKQEYALGLKKAQQSAYKDLKVIRSVLQKLQGRYSDQFSQQTKMSVQYSALLLELKNVEGRLLKTGTFLHEKEIINVLSVLREKIHMLSLNLVLLSKQEVPAKSVDKSTQNILKPFDDMFTTASLEDLQCIFLLQQLKIEVAFLYFNTLTYNFSQHSKASIRLHIIMMCLLLGSGFLQLRVRPRNRLVARKK